MIAGLYLNPQFLTAAACARIRAAMDRGVSEPAEILEHTVALDRDVRAATSVDVDSDTLTFVESALDAERESIAAFFGTPLSDREGAGFLRYEPGGRYRAHRDRGFVASWPAAQRRRVSIVLFLNSFGDPSDGEFTGGLLRLLEPHSRDIVPRQGLLVAFPAATLHEVTEVTDGTRDVIVDWFY